MVCQNNSKTAPYSNAATRIQMYAKMGSNNTKRETMLRHGVLQRYMPSDRALKLLTDGGLYFRRIDRYPEDPSEGNREVFGRQEQQILDGVNSMLPPELRMSTEDARKLASDWMHNEKQGVFIQSWFSHHEMSRYMWDTYGGFTRSVDCALIVVDLIKLGAYFDSVLPVGYRMSHIRYVPDKNSQRDGVFTKAERFRPEKEYRISIDLGELIPHNPKILPDFTWPLRPADLLQLEAADHHRRNKGIANEDMFRLVSNDGFILRVPLAEFVEEVYVPTAASESFCTRFDALLEAKGFGVRCKRIEVPEIESKKNE